MTTLTGQTVSHYKILERLGGGGMGVVYKAEDTKLKRPVALKFLPPDLTRDPEAKERFVHEAQAASALDHPNICTVYEINETDDGQLFIAMACYDGETLKKKIECGPLPINEVVAIASQVAQGLAKAHASSIIHRDIKPANIIVTKDGTAKIVDFGLAKLSGRTLLTKTGTTMGTAAYMSPEQARGEAVDQRADIWALGAVMYEMLSGTRPFMSEYQDALIYAILNTSPEPLSHLRPDVPEAVHRMVMKCLAREPADRYSSVLSIVDDLRSSPPGAVAGTSGQAVHRNAGMHRWVLAAMALTAVAVVASTVWLLRTNNGQPTISEKHRTIAVLPFRPITTSVEDRIFAEGMHDDILTQLTKIGTLKPIGIQSVLKYRDSDKPIRQIASELGAGTVLEGSARRSGDAIRIVARLIDGETENHIWAETYDRQYADIFALQSEVARRIAAALNAKIMSEEAASVDALPTMNPVAYEYFQKGKYFRRMSHELAGNLKAIEMLEKATELDSNFAMAHASLARSYTDVSGTLSPMASEAREEYRHKAAWRLAKAEQLSPYMVEVHLARGDYLYRVKKDIQSAQREYEAAYRLRPNDANVIADFAVFALSSQHDYETSLALSKKAIELDPLEGYGVSYAGWSALLLRRYAEAERYADLYIRTYPEDGLGYLQKVKVILWGHGDPAKAMEMWEEGKKLATRNTERLWRLVEMWEVPFYARDYKYVLALAETSRSNYRFMCRAFTYATMGNTREARVNLDSMHTALESSLIPGPDDAVVSTSLILAVVHAALGNGVDAFKYVSTIEGTRWSLGVWNVRDVILVYMYVGDVEKAINTIESSLSRPGGITRGMLRLDPRFDPLRKDARFQRLLIE